MTDQLNAPTADQAEFLQELFAAGLLIESGVPGVYGHGGSFELIRDRLASVVSDIAREHGAVRRSVPPIISRRDLESTGYIGNFPHLTGSIFGFDGTEDDAITLRDRATAHEDWSEFQSQSDLMMLPAACYPVYPAVARAGPLEPGGLFIDLGGTWVFRHEPSLDPARRQVFRQHELVRIGEEDAVIAWRTRLSELGLELFRELGLDGQLVIANDPFFGRHGRLLAASQSSAELKWELTVPIAGPEPTACASFNYHVDRFGETWGLKLSDGATAHTACVGFGQERIVLALLRTHGLDPQGWPDAVRGRLGLNNLGPQAL